MVKRGSKDLLQIAIGPTESLDLIKVDGGGLIFTITERTVVSRRTVVRLTRLDVKDMVDFLGGSDE